MGGGGGLGASIVKAFARQGAHVAFVDAAEQASNALAKELVEADAHPPWWEICDVGDVAALEAAIGRAEHALGAFSVIVNNVACCDRRAIEAVTVGHWDRCMAVNRRAAFFAIQAVAPGMRRLGGGSVINLGSAEWQISSGEYPSDAIARSWANDLTDSLAAALGSDRIRVNTVTPGWVLAGCQVELEPDAQSEETLREAQCLPDPLEGEDVARMVLFLASDDAAMCTAQEFRVDAGWIHN
jgi:NAD(P)-dependent dehydrogenase (short-subunit alcohol dehydrogenase family)